MPSRPRYSRRRGTSPIDGALEAFQRATSSTDENTFGLDPAMRGRSPPPISLWDAFRSDVKRLNARMRSAATGQAGDFAHSNGCGGGDAKSSCPVSPYLAPSGVVEGNGPSPVPSPLLQPRQPPAPLAPAPMESDQTALTSLQRQDCAASPVLQVRAFTTAWPPMNACLMPNSSPHALPPYGQEGAVVAGDPPHPPPSYQLSSVPRPCLEVELMLESGYLARTKVTVELLYLWASDVQPRDHHQHTAGPEPPSSSDAAVASAAPVHGTHSCGDCGKAPMPNDFVIITPRIRSPVFHAYLNQEGQFLPEASPIFQEYGFSNAFEVLAAVKEILELEEPLEFENEEYLDLDLLVDMWKKHAGGTCPDCSFAKSMPCSFEEWASASAEKQSQLLAELGSRLQQLDDEEGKREFAEKVRIYKMLLPASGYNPPAELEWLFGINSLSGDGEKQAKAAELQFTVNSPSAIRQSKQPRLSTDVASWGLSRIFDPTILPLVEALTSVYCEPSATSSSTTAASRVGGLESWSYHQSQTAYQHPAVQEALATLQRTLLVEDTPHVYSFPFLTPAFCDQLTSLVKHYEASGFPKFRPNSMNNYGLILNEIGLKPFFDALCRQVLYIVGGFLFPEASCSGTLDDHHTFIVEYRVGKDTFLDMHSDDSEVTFNVNLCESFEGSSLVFCGLRGDKNHRQHAATYQHKRGRLVCHAGSHRHGAARLTAGERYNLIIWTRSSQERARHVHGSNCSCGRKHPQEANPDKVCISFTHDRDALKWAPEGKGL